MDLIVAILLWIGAISPGESPTQQDIDQNQEAINYYSHDTDFMNYYNGSSTGDAIGIMDIDEGD